MGIIIKVIAIVLAVVIAVGIVGTLVGVGVGVFNYMARQNFDFKRAIEWSWDEYINWLQKINPIKFAEADEIYNFTNKNIDVVPCTSL